MRVLVTGGAGFIGSHVVDGLIARGDEVVVIDDLSTGSRDNLDPRAELVVGDIAETSTWASLVGDRPSLRRIDAIAHLASKTKVVESVEQPDLYRRVIIEGTAAVVALARSKRARVVNVSSGGAGYGETPICAVETDAQLPEAPYGRFKVQAEQLLDGIDGVTLRLANVYGPRQRSDLEGGVVSIFLERWRRKEPLTIYGDGTAERDYLYVGDIVSAVLAAIDRPVRGAFNIGSGSATSVNALVAEMSKLLGPPPGIVHAPPRPGEIGRSCLDATKAAREGLWRPAVPLAEGLRRTAS